MVFKTSSSYFHIQLVHTMGVVDNSNIWKIKLPFTVINSNLMK